jgi:hypothetical protein
MKKNKTKKSGQRNYLLWCNYVDKMTAMNIQPAPIVTYQPEKRLTA